MSKQKKSTGACITTDAQMLKDDNIHDFNHTTDGLWLQVLKEAMALGKLMRSKQSTYSYQVTMNEYFIKAYCDRYVGGHYEQKEVCSASIDRDDHKEQLLLMLVTIDRWMKKVEQEVGEDAETVD